ncbi:MAG: hypothetical protein LC799_33480, partial [Actinobacteria bacterium]|nr:hypothetical protein [Actinomycetota bacterium]
VARSRRYLPERAVRSGSPSGIYHGRARSAARDLLAYPLRMTVVRALLDGHQFDLQALAELFPDEDPRVVADPDEDGPVLPRSRRT